ncbi:efflux RND transporter periplasmic adaptor subunit [Stieleria sp. TO1_6]|uniref:site-2 protease family protein n=1 Tax=Stieleria tagensis TaxID=2956795 RepID=UPI00209B6884|nr:site-2 protease family protein [Stieleria tagensis]MCO8122207.1 efflux RND transporter periplasmic adaptor subunit [Stieleria tagensis]
MIDPSHLESQPTGTDPMATIVVGEATLEFTASGSGATVGYVAKDPRTGRFYRFGPQEFHCIQWMDGHRSLAEIHRQLERDGGHWTATDVLAFAQELTKHHLAAVLVADDAPTDDDATNAVVEQADCLPAEPQQRVTGTGQPSLISRWIRFGSGLLSQRLPLVDGDRVATRLLPSCSVLFSRLAMLVWTVLVASGIAIVWDHADLFSSEIRRVFDQQMWIVLAVIWCLLKVVHECGHAICAKRHGVRVGPMGIMFFLFAPLAYVDVTDAWKLIRRRDRIQIALAGVYLELGIGAIAAWVWWLSPIGMTKHLAAQIFLVAGPATLLVNANPLLRLDGYYVLSDLLEIPNLRAQGRRRLIAVIERVLFGLPIPASALAGWRRDAALLHAFCSVIFQIVWMTGLVIAITSWAKGLGIVIAVVAALLWGLLPLVRWAHKIWTIQPPEGWILNVYQRRLIAYSSLICMAVQFACLHTSPFSRRVPVVVRYQDEQIARAPVAAFVSGVFVRCGDRVRRGTLLMELDQPELIITREQWLDQREVALAKAIQHRRRGEIAVSRIAQDQADSLDRKLAELEQQIESLRIIAQRDGRITSPATDRLLGSYVAGGQELLRVSDPQEKELLALVAEDNLLAYQTAALGGHTANIRLRGGVAIETPLVDVQPSASRQIPHPALAATVGGPLAVQSIGAAHTQTLVHPQLQSVLPLDVLTSLKVQSGQIGRLTIPDDRTLISRIWDHVRENN